MAKDTDSRQDRQPGPGGMGPYAPGTVPPPETRPEDRGSGLAPARIALIALLIALTTVLTILVRIPVPATQGYVNLSDVAITFIGLTFGPWAGLIAGGVGAALADLFGGYTQFAPLSFVAHGLEGLLIGLLIGRRRALPAMVVAWAAGAVVMVAGYLLGEGLVLTSWPAALAESPFNIFQAVVGVVAGIPLAIAVRRAYPPIDQIGRRRAWREETGNKD